MASGFVAGGYLERRTWLHHVDATAKVAALLVLTVACFVARQGGVLLLAAAVVAIAATCGIGPRTLVRSLRPAVVVLAFALVANALRLDGSGDVPLVGMVGFSSAGAARGAAAVGRIASLVALVLLVSATTTVSELADALTAAFAPLARLGLPAGDMAMVVAVALRFVPEVAGEFGKIVDAQRARGARFDQGGPRRRLAAWSTVLVPLVLALFRRSEQLAQAMADRGYEGGMSQADGHRWGVGSWGTLLGAVVLAAASLFA